MRSYRESDERRTIDMEAEGRRERRRPKKEWKDCKEAEKRQMTQ